MTLENKKNKVWSCMTKCCANNATQKRAFLMCIIFVHLFIFLFLNKIICRGELIIINFKTCSFVLVLSGFVYISHFWMKSKIYKKFALWKMWPADEGKLAWKWMKVKQFVLKNEQVNCIEKVQLKWQGSAVQW